MRALIFDLDGTLFDSVYAHVLSWQKSFAAEGLRVPAWSIHNKIVMGGQEPPQRDHEGTIAECRAAAGRGRAAAPLGRNACSLGHRDLRRSDRGREGAAVSG